MRFPSPPDAGIDVGKSCDIFFECAEAAWLLPLDRLQIAALLAAMRNCAGLDGEALELHIVDDAEIADLNARFLGRAGPTNIITFPPSPGMAGSMHLSADCLVRESLVYGQDVAVHFARLLAHGFGHLAGLDHGREMAALEQECFEKAINLIDCGFEG